MKINFFTTITTREPYVLATPIRKKAITRFWTEKELTTLLALHNSGDKKHTIAFIAKQLNRTPLACSSKLSKLYHDADLIRHLGFTV